MRGTLPPRVDSTAIQSGTLHHRSGTPHFCSHVDSPTADTPAGPGKEHGFPLHSTIQPGVALMHLDRIRQSNWTAGRDAIMKQWITVTTMGALPGKVSRLGTTAGCQPGSNICSVPSRAMAEKTELHPGTLRLCLHCR